MSEERLVFNYRDSEQAPIQEEIVEQVQVNDTIENTEVAEPVQVQEVIAETPAEVVNQEVVTLEKLTNNKFKDLSEIDAIVSEYESLKNKGVYKTEFAKNLDEFIASGGDAEDFIRASKISVDGLTDIEKAKLHLKLTGPKDLTDDEIDTFIKRKYSYSEDEFSEVDPIMAKLGAAQLKIDAEKYTQEILDIKNKATYIPEKVEAKSPNNGLSQEEIDAANLAHKQLQEGLNSFTGYELSIEDEESKVKVSIPIADKEFLKQASEDPTVIFSKFYREDGSIDTNKFYRAVNYIANMDEYDKIIAKTSVSQGKESLLNKFNNPSDTQTNKGEFSKGKMSREEFLNQFR